MRRLKGYTGRVLRDIERQLDKVPEGRLKARLEEMTASGSGLKDPLEPKSKDHKRGTGCRVGQEKAGCTEISGH